MAAAQELQIISSGLSQPPPPPHLKLPTPPRLRRVRNTSNQLTNEQLAEAGVNRQHSQSQSRPLEASAPPRNTTSNTNKSDDKGTSNYPPIVINFRDWPTRRRIRRPISATRPGPIYPTLEPSPLRKLYKGPLKLDEYHHVPRLSASPGRLAPEPNPLSATFLLPYFCRKRFANYLPPIRRILQLFRRVPRTHAMTDRPTSPLALREKPGDSTLHQAQSVEQSSQVGESSAIETGDHTINPYETDPNKIPKTDKYLSHHPHHGRYLPQENDFRPDERYVQSTSPEALAYWEQLLIKCNLETRVNTPRQFKRDTFAVGSVIVKSGHLSSSSSQYDKIDRNEDLASKEAANLLPEYQIPTTLFRSKIRDRDVLVQSRIPGVSLKVAWPYLTVQQKKSFKDQARDILLRMREREIPDKVIKSGFLALEDSKEQWELTPEKHECLFKREGKELFASHNDMRPSNIIVNDDKIIGIVGCGEMGFFTWEGMSDLHVKKCLDNKDTPIPELFEFEVPWHDLYDIPSLDTSYKTKGSTPVTETAPIQPTPKKVEDLKRKSASRASSSERSSPVPQSSSQPGPKKRAHAPPPVTKKGTAKRNPAPKRRKLNDSPSVDDATATKGRESTPASRLGKGPMQRGRKQDSLSVTGSPAPENNKKSQRNVSALENEMDVDDEDDEDDSQIFCVCRRPDNHTWMIGCDGGCEDWFHGKCMNINHTDADLIDKYICPSCEKTCGMQTTWKPMCRAPGCRQPARVWLKTPSKYCSDEHGKKCMSGWVESRAPKLRVIDPNDIVPILPLTKPSNGSDNNNSGDQENGYLSGKGGILTGGDLKAVISRVNSATEFRRLGHTPLSSHQAELKERLVARIAAPISYDELGQLKDIVLEAPDDKVQFTPEEREQMNNLRTLGNKLNNRKEMLAEREKFLGISRQRAKIIFERLQSHGLITGIQWKDACGFDSRFSQSDEEFDAWRKSEAGTKLLDEGADGDEALKLKDEGDSASVEKIAQGICLKKRCERHKQWLKVMQQDNLFEQTTLEEQTSKCEKDTEEFVTKVVMRVPDE